MFKRVGRDSIVGIETCYRLDCQGIEFRWGEIFCTCPDWSWGPPTQWYRVFPGGKVAGAWC